MRKTIPTILASAVITVSAIQMAAAAERHHPRKAATVSASEKFNNANNSIAPQPTESNAYFGYYSGGGMSAPAGH
jgi:hypothetical protein